MSNLMSNGCLPTGREPKLSWWHYPHLLGLDVAFTAYLWALAYSKLLGVVMLSQEALILLVGSVWFSLMVERLYKSLTHRPIRMKGFYSATVPFFFLLLVCVALSLLWTFYYHVNVMLLRYTLFSVFFLSMQFMPVLSGYDLYRKACKALAFAFACAIPAYYSCFLTNFLGMLVSPAIGCLALLIFLLSLDKYRHEGKDTAMLGLMQVAGQLLLILVSLRFAYVLRESEEGIYFAFIMSSACLGFIGRLRNRLSADSMELLRWPIMMIAPLFGVALFM